MKKVDNSGQLRKPVKREEQAQATGQLIEEAQARALHSNSWGVTIFIKPVVFRVYHI
jgi:hypothetical protein